MTVRETFTIFDVSASESYSAHQIEHQGASAVDVEVDIDAWAGNLSAMARAGNYFFSLNRYLFTAIKPRRTCVGLPAGATFVAAQSGG